MTSYILTSCQRQFWFIWFSHCNTQHLTRVFLKEVEWCIFFSLLTQRICSDPDVNHSQYFARCPGFATCVSAVQRVCPVCLSSCSFPLLTHCHLSHLEKMRKKKAGKWRSSPIRDSWHLHFLRYSIIISFSYCHISSGVEGAFKVHFFQFRKALNCFPDHEGNEEAGNEWRKHLEVMECTQCGA